MTSPKHFFFFLLFIAFFTVHGQKARLEKVIISERTYLLENEDQAFECNLAYYDRSDVSFSLYTAKGEIRSLSRPFSFAVVAFVSPSKITIYHFKEVSLADELLSFEGDYFNPWECEEVLSNKEGFERKIILEKGNASWIEQNDTISYIVNTESSKLYEEQEYLWWGSKRNSLSNNSPIRNFEIEAQAENRVVLSYSFGSNPYNPMGRCGAGEERGLLTLEVDERGNIVKDSLIPLESCYRDLYFSRESRSFGSIDYYYYEVESEKGVKKYYFRPSNAIVSESIDDIFEDQ